MNSELHRIRAKSRAFWPCLFLLMLPGCYPEGPVDVDELDIVYTNYDPTFDFSKATTFAIPDSVIEIGGSEFQIQTGNKPSFVSSAYRDMVLKTVRENMANLGWTEVDKNDHPSVIILPSVFITTYVYYYYDWYYWNWWYPGWYGGLSWYYPWNYRPAYSGYRTGTLFIQMIDPSAPVVNNKVRVVWFAIINGLLGGSVTSSGDRLHSTINQAFVQSSYLGH